MEKLLAQRQTPEVKFNDSKHEQSNTAKPE